MEATANIPEALRQQPWHVTNPEREVTTLSILYFFNARHVCITTGALGSLVL